MAAIARPPMSSRKDFTLPYRDTLNQWLPVIYRKCQMILAWKRSGPSRRPTFDGDVSFAWTCPLATGLRRSPRVGSVPLGRSELLSRQDGR